MEAIVRLFFVILKFLINHWGWFLTLMILSFLVQKMRYLPSLLGFIVNLATDGMSILGDALSLGTGVIVTLLLGAIPSAIIGFMWVSIIMGSSANMILRVITIPFALVFGFVWGYLPLPLPIEFGMESLGSKPAAANIMCIVLIVATIFLPLLLGVLFTILGSFIGFFSGQEVCMWINDLLVILSN